MRPTPRHIYLHSEDLDGWLAWPNQPLLPAYRDCFSELEGLRCEAADGIHELRIILNSGKSPEYLEAHAAEFGGRHVIGCSGAAWRECGGMTHTVAPPSPDFSRLRSLLGIGEDAVGVAALSLRGRTACAAIEEGKRVAGRDIVLTLFPEPDHVAHRWTFKGDVDRVELRDHLRGLIAEHQLELAVLEPYGDGALDIVPVVGGRALGKWTLPQIAARMFPGADLRICHGGDGPADLLAMEAPGVTALSAENCAPTVTCARSRAGVVARCRAPEGGATLKCYAELARREFYGPLSEIVLATVERHFEAWDRSG